MATHENIFVADYAKRKTGCRANGCTKGDMAIGEFRFGKKAEGTTLQGVSMNGYAYYHPDCFWSQDFVSIITSKCQLDEHAKLKPEDKRYVAEKLNETEDDDGGLDTTVIGKAADDDAECFCFCGHVVDDGDDALQCHGCEEWVHARCILMDSATYKALTLPPLTHLQFVCASCKKDDVAKLKRERKKLLYENQAAKDKLLNQADKYQALAERHMLL
jgi:hypothetical protein